MYVCLCKAVTADRIREVVEKGARDVDDVSQACHAGSDCGTCRFKINKIIKTTLGNEDADQQEAI